MAYASGELDQRVTLERKVKTRDGAGGATESWITYATVYALVRPMTGHERENAMREEAVANYLIVVRRRTDVVEGHRIGWNGRKLNVRFVKTRMRKSFLEIEADMGVPS